MGARYFVTKCDHIKRLYKAKETSVWACTDRRYGPQPKDVLSEAFDQGTVILIFSANNCHGWHGFASMVTKPDDLPSEGDDASPVPMKEGTIPSELTFQGQAGLSKHTTKYEDIEEETLQNCTASDVKVNNNVEQMTSESGVTWHKFGIEWHVLFLAEHGEQCLPFAQTEAITISKDGSPLNKARNLQELPVDTGRLLCDMISLQYKQLSEEKERKAKAKAIKMGDPFFQPEPGSEKDPMLVWNKLLLKVKSMGTVLLACAFGSQRYNLHTADSDMDMFVVYVADTKDILGFNPPKHTIKNRDSEVCDYTIHEVHRYGELLLAGDPRCVETLFLHPTSVYYVSLEWTELCKHRFKFLNKLCLEKYVRDATGGKGTVQLDKWIASGEALQTPMPRRVCKLFYIIIRLLQNAKEIAQGDELKVYRDVESPERQLLMKTRNGELTLDFLKTHADSLVSDIDRLKTERAVILDIGGSQLQQVLECWLLLIRYRNLEKYMQTKLHDS